MSACTQPGCTGQILDGYCDVCGMAASAAPAAGRPVRSAHPPSARWPPAPARDVGPHGEWPGRRARGSAPCRSGSQRATGSRRTQRLGGRRPGSTSLGAGLVSVPPVPTIDPSAALMDPAVVAEHKRFCAQCQAAVGRARGDQPGRTKGFCPKCRTPFDFDPRLQPGMLVGGQYEVAGCLAHGGMGWIYLARDRNVNGRWVVLKGLLNSWRPGRLPGRRLREAVPRRGRAPADRRDLQLRDRARRRLLHRDGVRRRHVAQRPRQAAHERSRAAPTRRCRSSRPSPT